MNIISFFFIVVLWNAHKQRNMLKYTLVGHREIQMIYALNDNILSLDNCYAWMPVCHFVGIPKQTNEI